MTWHEKKKKTWDHETKQYENKMMKPIKSNPQFQTHSYQASLWIPVIYFSPLLLKPAFALIKLCRILKRRKTF